MSTEEQQMKADAASAILAENEMERRLYQDALETARFKAQVEREIQELQSTPYVLGADPTVLPGTCQDTRHSKKRFPSWEDILVQAIWRTILTASGAGVGWFVCLLVNGFFHLTIALEWGGVIGGVLIHYDSLFKKKS